MTVLTTCPTGTFSLGQWVNDSAYYLPRWEHFHWDFRFRYMTMLTAFPKRNIFIGTFRYMAMLSTCPNRNIFIGTSRGMTVSAQHLLRGAHFHWRTVRLNTIYTIYTRGNRLCRRWKTVKPRYPCNPAQDFVSMKVRSGCN